MYSDDFVLMCCQLVSCYRYLDNNILDYNLEIEDYYPYFGKLMSQFGVIYNLNDLLEYELVCLNILDEPVTENENYLKRQEVKKYGTIKVTLMVHLIV